MTYREWAPPASLAGSVVCLWSRTETETSAPALVLPDGCVDLIWESGRGAFVAGPDTGPMPGTTEAAKTLVGVRLRPAAGGPVLGLPLDELCNQRVDLSELRPALARRLDGALPSGSAGRFGGAVPAASARRFDGAPPSVSARRLDGALSPGEALRRLLAFTGELVEERPPDPALLEAVRLLHDPRVRVHELSARLDIGDRQLRRRFTAAVGYGPKTLHRVLRFRRFLTLLESPGGLAELAERAGYVDQAHLSRETAQLAGLPPSALARRWGRAA